MLGTYNFSFTSNTASNNEATPVNRIIKEKKQIESVPVAFSRVQTTYTRSSTSHMLMFCSNPALKIRDYL